jgi:transposase InsO family protein
MPWQEVTIMSQRLVFVMLALREGANIRQLCRGFGISPKTAYKWLGRFRASGERGLGDRSRCPHAIPRRTPPEIEEAILAIRAAHPAWGGRKIRACLEGEGWVGLPSASTITEVLRRHGQLQAEESAKRRSFQRFERSAPNELWQMDFKSRFPLQEEGHCYPLTILDDHSRFLIALRACGHKDRRTVQAQLTLIFQEYGLPEVILVDHGQPWGCSPAHPYTKLRAWLIRLGIFVRHSRPYHPQTLGKDERLHRTLQEELLNRERFANLQACQEHFDRWREIYNHQRPHQALDMAVPSSRYHPSSRPFPETLPPITYLPDHIIRHVSRDGSISFRTRHFVIGKGFSGYPVALRPTEPEGAFHVYFCHQQRG